MGMAEKWMTDSTAEGVFSRIAGEEGAGQPGPSEGRNGLRHIAALSMTKVADGLIDPKLVLAWLLTALGAPAVFAGALVPIREAGALLPQMPLAALLQRLARRKWIWVLGSAGQGLAAGMIVLAALSLEGQAAGLAICAALALLAVCRAACSVSYKAILGKTVSLSRRGAVTGLAGSASSVGVLVFAALLILGPGQSAGLVIAAIALAALFWGAAALLFTTLEEERSETGGDTIAHFAVLREDPVLWRFIITRGLLVSTALAPPYLVVLSGESTLGRLGALVLASALASLVSSYVWGRLADHSSRRVLMFSGLLGAVAMGAGVALWALGVAGQWMAMPLVLFVLMIAYHGVRQGRSTYLVDLAPEGRRAAYAAVTNTVIGVLLLGAGVLGGGAALIGPEATLTLFAVMAIAAFFTARGLTEAEGL